MLMRLRVVLVVVVGTTRAPYFGRGRCNASLHLRRRRIGERWCWTVISRCRRISNFPNGSFQFAFAFDPTAGFRELLEQSAFRVVSERTGGFSEYHGGGFLSHLFALQVSFEGIKKESIVWD